MISEDSNEKELHILLSGRIYSQQQTFKNMIEIIDHFVQFSKPFFYVLDEKTLQKIKLQRQKVKCFEFNSHNHQNGLNYLVSIGGDGTILYTAKQLKERNKAPPPILAFHSGTLGFMCQFTLNQKKEIIELATKFVHKQKQPDFPFNINQRMRLQCTINAYQTQNNIMEQKCTTSKSFALNEVYISRPKCERIILKLYINNEFVTQTAGDGILISTPNGSTAYSLSAGGPIVSCGVNGILIVPIAPNSLSFRPICIPADSKIRIVLATKSRSHAMISMDGQSYTQFTINHELLINQAKHNFKFYQPKGHLAKMQNWMQRLKCHLGWNDSFKLQKNISIQNEGEYYNFK